MSFAFFELVGGSLHVSCDGTNYQFPINERQRTELAEMLVKDQLGTPMPWATGIEERLKALEEQVGQIDTDLHIGYDDRLKVVEGTVDNLVGRIQAAAGQRNPMYDTNRIDHLERQVADLMAKWAEAQHAEGIDDPDTVDLLGKLVGKLLR